MNALLDSLCSELAANPMDYPRQKHKIQRALRLIGRKNNFFSGSPHSSSLKRYYKLIQNTISFIDKNYSKKIYIDELCKLNYVSKKVFCQVFKEVTGITFSEYLIGYRLLHAGLALVNTDAPIEEIALSHGFKNRVHFFRQFKHYMGYTPHEFRMKNHTHYMNLRQ